MSNAVHESGLVCRKAPDGKHRMKSVMDKISCIIRRCARFRSTSNKTDGTTIEPVLGTGYIVIQEDILLW